MEYKEYITKNSLFHVLSDGSLVKNGAFQPMAPNLHTHSSKDLASLLLQPPMCSLHFAVRGRSLLDNFAFLSQGSWVSILMSLSVLGFGFSSPR